MAPRAPGPRGVPRCCFPHCPQTGQSAILGLHRLLPSVSPSTVLQLLGLTDRGLQDKMSQWHPYVLQLGGGNYLSDSRQAAEHLLLRNLPEVAKDQQKKPVYVPESHLPNVPRAVDVARFEMVKAGLIPVDRQFLGVAAAGDTTESQNLVGDQAERELAEVVKEVLARMQEKEVLVLFGPEFKPPNSRPGSQWEQDVVLVFKRLSLILDIESKATLNSKAITSSTEQLERMKKVVETYFSSSLPSGQWHYAAMVHYNQNKAKSPVCASCQPFTIEGCGQLESKLTALLASIPASTPNHGEYSGLVRDLLFTVLARPLATRCKITDEIFDKIVGKPDCKTCRDCRSGRRCREFKVGQGDLKSIIFWTICQANLMLTFLQFVFFSSPWSCGKTLCKTEKARMRAVAFPGEMVTVAVMRWICKRKTLLEMELEEQFSDLPNVSIIGINLKSASDVATVTQRLLTELQARPGSWFIDELTVPEPQDHAAFRQGLGALVQHMRGQPSQPLLWISMAGISGGKPEHFQPAYLRQSLLPPDFQLPDMSSPLRSTEGILTFAGLKGRDTSQPLGVAAGGECNPDYSVPPQLLAGLACRRIPVKNTRAEVVAAVAEARQDVAARQGGRDTGVPVLCDSMTTPEQIQWIVSGLGRGRGASSGPALVYTGRGEQGEATEGEVAVWLENRRRGTGTRDMVTDDRCSRG